MSGLAILRLFLGSFCEVFIEKKYLLSTDHGLDFPNFNKNSIGNFHSETSNM